MAGKNVALDTVSPYVLANKQVPRQDVAPLFRDKVGVPCHADKGRLRISAGVENIIKLGQRCRSFGTSQDNGHDDNKQVQQATEDGYFQVAHE